MEQVISILKSHLGRISIPKNQIELTNEQDQPWHCGTNPAGPETREFEKAEL